MFQEIDEPELRLLAALVRCAIRDAKQRREERLRREASRWLWTHAPAMAKRAGVPTVEEAADSP